MGTTRERAPRPGRSCAIVLVLVLIPLAVLLLAGALLPAQFADTWYGALPIMTKNLRETEGKKVVVVGNSNIAFGVDSALAERLLREAGLDYSVCKLGLYGSLGTRMMLELALPLLGEGDILVFSPELNRQSLSLYFSEREAWYALEGDVPSVLTLSGESRAAMLGGFAGFTAERFSRWRSGTPAEGSGVYASASFDDRGDLTRVSRPHNIMEDGFDANDPIRLEASLLTEEFLAYLNGYARQVQQRGARMVWSHAPANRAALSDEEYAKAAAWDRTLALSLSFPVISAAEDYIMEPGWFYDSNCHLNDAGAVVRTVQLVNDLKNELGNTTKTAVVLPEEPVIPRPGIEGEGDNSCAQFFTYEQDGNYYVITGLTPEGAQETQLVIPYQVDGLYVKGFLPGVFAGDRVIERVVIQENIRTLSDGSFSGCTRLREIVLRHSDPAGLSVGFDLLEGVSAQCRICVPAEARELFINNYFWGNYGTRILGY